MQAQREAAWGEVARRLAHEIKNPLTPIRLSAERMRHKLLPSIKDEKDAQMLERATETIVQQVEAMKEMVNAFSEYARAPRLEMTPVDLNRLVTEVTDLYRAQDPQRRVRLVVDLDAMLGTVVADPGRLRQLLHNLLTNAVEALEGQPGGEIAVSTRLAQRGGGDETAELVVADNGRGFDTGTGSSGNGLRNMRRRTEAMGGAFTVSTGPEGGTQVSLSMPLA